MVDVAKWFHRIYFYASKFIGVANLVIPRSSLHFGNSVRFVSGDAFTTLIYLMKVDGFANSPCFAMFVM